MSQAASFRWPIFRPGDVPLDFPFQLQKLTPGWCREVVVVRDDLLPGGTKTRFLPDVIGDAKEIVFGGPFCGGAPVALAVIGQVYRRKVTLFYAKRDTPHRRQQSAIDYGANVVWVPLGFMTHVQKRAREYAASVGALFLPLGFDVSAAEPPFVEAMRKVTKAEGAFDEVWCATGSGMLARCLGKAFPDSKVTAVAVGLRSRWANQTFPPNVRVVEAPMPYAKECNIPTPFPACPNYERKAWLLAEKEARGRVLFWNVIGD